MSSPALTAWPDETLAAVAERMADAHTGSAVVVNADDVPVGIITERDLLKASGDGTNPTESLVIDWMSPDPVTANADKDANEALDELLERGFRHLPIVDKRHLVGIVSMRDLIGVMGLSKIRTEPQGSDLLTEEQVAIFRNSARSGLEKIVAAETALSRVDGEAGKLTYRGYDAVDLAMKRSFESVWYLFLHGELPTRAKLRSFERDTAEYRVLPDGFDSTLRDLVRADADPMYVLRTAASAVGVDWGLVPWLDQSDEEMVEAAVRYVAILPTLVAAIHRLRHGLEPVAPDPDLGHAANYLYMLTGDRPDADQTTGVERYLILTADHGMNASTFTARVVTSTGSDVGSAVTAAIGALAGPLHGGAPSRVLDTLDEIGTAENAEAWMRDHVETGNRLMGFGHRVYKVEDPRAAALRATAREIGGDLFDLAEAAETAALAVLDELKPGRKLYTNVEYYSAIVLHESGLDRELFPPTFASSRIVGWTAQILEQARSNRLIRPSAQYTGPEPRRLPRLR